MLIGSFAFANVTSVESDTFNNKIALNTSDENHFNVLYDLGDVSNLSETEFSNLFDNLPDFSYLDSKLFDECSISYSITLSLAGQSVTVTVTGTAADCETAGKIAREGAKTEAIAAKTFLMSLI